MGGADKESRGQSHTRHKGMRRIPDPYGSLIWDPATRSRSFIEGRSSRARIETARRIPHGADSRGHSKLANPDLFTYRSSRRGIGAEKGHWARPSELSDSRGWAATLSGEAHLGGNV